MRSPARLALGFAIATAGAGAIAFAAAPHAAAAPMVCPALPGQTASSESCSASASNTGLSLAITADGGHASSIATNYAGPAAIAIGPNASVTMTGVRPGLAIGIAGPGASVTVDGVHGPTCSGTGMAFAGDFQTLQGCWR